MKIKLVNDIAYIPERIRKGDAGLSLRSIEQKILGPGDTWRFKLGIAIQLDWGYVGLTQGRSGNAQKYSIETIGNVIDCNYRGEISVLLKNNGDKFFKVNIGDNIAQLLIMPVWLGDLLEVDVLDYNTERGEKGFGSSDNILT